MNTINTAKPKENLQLAEITLRYDSVTEFHDLV
jgi:hypothetical protein